MDAKPTRCMTVRELAAHWRVGTRKVRALVRRGLLTAIDHSLGIGGRSALRFTPDAIRDCERRLAVVPRAARQATRYDDIDPEILRLLGGAESA